LANPAFGFIMANVLDKGFDFFLKSDFSGFEDGEWVAIHKDRVISHGRSLKTVVEQAKGLVPPSDFLVSRVKKTASFL